jgi:hypothetical protein
LQAIDATTFVRDPDLQTLRKNEVAGSGFSRPENRRRACCRRWPCACGGTQLPEFGEAAVEGRLALARIGIALGLRGRIQEAVGYAIMLKIPTYSNANLWAKRIDPAAATRPGNT